MEIYYLVWFNLMGKMVRMVFHFLYVEHLNALSPRLINPEPIEKAIFPPPTNPIRSSSFAMFTFSSAEIDEDCSHVKMVHIESSFF